jgi:hypothetical protein
MKVPPCVDRVHTLQLGGNGMRAKRPRVKTAEINIRTDPKLKALAQKAAAADRRTLSGLIEKLLEDHLKAHGFLKPRGKS